MPFTAMIDYGMGNLLSVSKALTAVGADIRIVSNPEDAAGAACLVLPGVGNFGDGMQHLKDSGFIPFVREWTMQNKPFLGICLGMQMLLDSSEEAPGVPGLGIIPGRVLRFPAGKEKVPHIGWNSVTRNPASDNALFSADPEWFYFVHSYYVQPADSADTAAVCGYIHPFAAALTRKNLLAVQFHPEKSQDAGLALLQKFFKKTLS